MFNICMPLNKKKHCSHVPQHGNFRKLPWRCHSNKAVAGTIAKMRKLSLNIRHNSASTVPSFLLLPAADATDVEKFTSQALRPHLSPPAAETMFFAVWSAQLRLRCVCVDDCYYSCVTAWLARHLAESGWTGVRANDPSGNTRAITETQSIRKSVSERDVLQTKPLDSLD